MDRMPLASKELEMKVSAVVRVKGTNGAEANNLVSLPLVLGKEVGLNGNR